MNIKISVLVYVRFSWCTSQNYNLITTSIIGGKTILQAVTLLFAHKAPLYILSFFFFLMGLKLKTEGEGLMK